MDVTVSYSPASPVNTQTKAMAAAAHFAALLQRAGVSTVNAMAVPATGPEEVSQTTIHYKTLAARAADGCKIMGGLDGTPTTTNLDYPMGCAIQAQVARQVANPQDLAGRDGLDEGSGRRQANIVEVYQKGAPNPPMQNTQSSTATSP